MKLAAQALLALAAIFIFPSCQQASASRTSKSPPKPLVTSEALAPSPRLIVGRIIAIDAERRFAFIELASDFPAAATQPETELIARTLDLNETATLRASRYVRGRTLGTTIIAGKPTPGDEVVWLAP